MNSSSTVDKQHEKPIFSCIFNHNIVLDSEKIVSQPRADMQEVCVLSSEQQTDKQRSIDCEATLSPFSIANSLFPKPTAELNKNLKNVEDLIQKTNKRKKYELDCFTENALLSKDIGDKENRSLKESKSSVKRRKQQAEMKRYDCKTKMYEAKTRRYEVKIRRYEAETRRYEMETKKYEFKTLKMLAKLHKKYKELNISAESSSSSISLPSFENPENSLLNPETHHFTTF
ncbi:uncharacterized protein BX663DRAFT_285551 [Cokeromyces recurvatus]|uniref:uncharacterized protein n=1 Tax=Cokeromyces recurvatus TaxID=90255 RepID=UPI00222087DF|nr:uncharacterized protein BX663DRAFT_285551 [Cokeromyces recurvatus]KAI7905526.1 hypothetical protein BX663DRAFT_285551 [Cokeromyces recurvatus]